MAANKSSDKVTGQAQLELALEQHPKSTVGRVQMDSVFQSAPGDKKALQSFRDRAGTPDPEAFLASERDESWRKFPINKEIQAAEGPLHQWNPNDRPPPIEQIIARDYKNDKAIMDTLKAAVDARAKGDPREIGEIFLDKAKRKERYTPEFARLALDQAKMEERNMKFDFAAQKLSQAFFKPDQVPPGVSPFDFFAKQAPNGMTNPNADILALALRKLRDMPSDEYVAKLRSSEKTILDGISPPIQH